MPESLRARPPPLAWGGRNGGDERLRQLIAMMHEREHTWGLLEPTSRAAPAASAASAGSTSRAARLPSQHLLARIL